MAIVVLAALLLDSMSLAQQKSPARAQAALFGRAPMIFIAPGGEQRRLPNYRDVVSKETGFQTTPTLSLDDLFWYFGFALDGKEVELAEPDALMARAPAGAILATRYFAPKITDVSNPAGVTQYGWRKLARFSAQQGSGAAKGGLKYAYALFNVFSADLDSSPFKKADGSPNHSVNNQVLVVRAPGSGLSKPAYFMTFESYGSSVPSEQGRLITYLDATFDAAVQPSVKRYYVPSACADCHGGTTRTKVNYLDTDHWFDRVANDDFDAVGKKQALVFDAGTNDVTRPAFKVAFDVIRRINSEILEQNKDADGAGVTFQQRAVASWVKNHAADDNHVSLFKRNISADGTSWSESDAVDRELLPRLNRYCYRCHSSVRYHIYDKTAVRANRDDMISRINENPNGDPAELMPQDRALVDPDRSKLLDLLGRLP